MAFTLAVSSAARSNVTAVFDQFGYSDNWISFGLSKCLSCSDFPCSHVCNRYTADYDVCECPPCWELGRDMTTCVPKTENYSLTCSSGMKVTLDSCVLGAASQNGDAAVSRSRARGSSSSPTRDCGNADPGQPAEVQTAKVKRKPSCGARTVLPCMTRFPSSATDRCNTSRWHSPAPHHATRRAASQNQPCMSTHAPF